MTRAKHDVNILLHRIYQICNINCYQIADFVIYLMCFIYIAYSDLYITIPIITYYIIPWKVSKEFGNFPAT